MLWARVCLPPLRRDQPSATAPEAKMTLWWAGWLLEDFFVSHVVLRFDAKDGAQAALAKVLKQPDLLPVKDRSFGHRAGGWEQRRPCIPGSS